MNIINKLLPLLIVLICFSSCRKDNDEFIDNGSNTPDPVINIQSSFNGIVYDADGNAIENATIELGNQLTETDENGYYLISDIVNKNGTYIKVSASGYFDGYGSVLPSNEGTTYVKFKLKERGVGSIITSDNPNQVVLDDNKVVFQPNSFIDENGNKYTGDVTVYMDYIDPSSDDMGEIMPGDLNAISAQNESGILKSFGMLNVEMFGSNGEALDIDQPAQLNIDIPEDFSSDAPSTIPMWYFDTETGLWVEEGSATRVGDHYEATVNHFTLWNCDVFDEAYVLSGQVVSRFPLTNIKVRVNWISANDSRTTYTDSDGYFSGKVPAGEHFQIEILDECNKVIKQLDIEPLTQDEFYTINVNPNEYNSVLVTGTIQDCDGDLVTNGYALISLTTGTNHYATVDGNGMFSLNLVNCNSNAEVKVQGIDLDNLEQGLVANYSISNYAANCGNVRACGGGSVTLGLTATLDNGVYINIPLVTVTPDTVTLPTQVYTFEALDSQNNGETKLIYNITFLQWDPLLPDWASSSSVDIINPPVESQWSFGSNIVNGSILETPDYIEFTCDQIEIRDELTGTVHISNDFIIRGAR